MRGTDQCFLVLLFIMLNSIVDGSKFQFSERNVRGKERPLNKTDGTVFFCRPVPWFIFAGLTSYTQDTGIFFFNYCREFQNPSFQMKTNLLWSFRSYAILQNVFLISEYCTLLVLRRCHSKLQIFNSMYI